MLSSGCLVNSRFKPHSQHDSKSKKPMGRKCDSGLMTRRPLKLIRKSFLKMIITIAPNTIFYFCWNVFVRYFCFSKLSNSDAGSQLFRALGFFEGLPKVHAVPFIITLSLFMFKALFSLLPSLYICLSSFETPRHMCAYLKTEIKFVCVDALQGKI